jgi:hypothetical protein
MAKALLEEANNIEEAASVEQGRGKRKNSDVDGSEPKTRRITRMWRQITGNNGASTSAPNAPATRRRQVPAPAPQDEPDTVPEGDEWPATVQGKPKF